MARLIHETMRSWETAHTLAGQSAVSLDFARIWQAADKIVYSTTLPAADTARIAGGNTHSIRTRAAA